MQSNRRRLAISGQRRIVVVAGSDTGVGKTVLTALLTQQLRADGINAVALKPLCSGGREDAETLHVASDGALTMNEVNPWHFRVALAPVLAARRAGRRVKLSEVVAHVRAAAERFELVLVEGAGGLLSPLGERFDARDLISELHALPIIVVPNRLGAVNQARLLLEAIPQPARSRAQLVLVEQSAPDTAARSNAQLLKEWAPGITTTLLPWVDAKDGTAPNRRVATALKPLVSALRARRSWDRA